jgi:hypothetical protein
MNSKFKLSDKVIINGNIMTNNYPSGGLGQNNLVQVSASNLLGSIIDIEIPSQYNNLKYLYTIKLDQSINGNFYAVEVAEEKLSKYSYSSNYNLNDPYNPYNIPTNTPYNIKTAKKFYVGQSVFLQNVYVILLHPTRTEYISYKVGVISAVLFGNLYQITFSDNTIATNVEPSVINVLLPKSNYNSNAVYQDISEDEDLQEDVTKYYLKKTLKWIKKDNTFSKLKKFKKILESDKGYKVIYKILKKFLIKNNKLKWYDLRDKSNYEDIQDYIRKKLSSL